MKFIRLLFLYFLSTFSILSCSDILLGSKDSIVSARTMDMDSELKAKIFLVPRNLKWTSEPCGKIKGISWTNRYGFVAVNTLGEKTVYCDGMNEKGLSAANLYLKETSYPIPQKGEEILPVMDIVGWILGNFETVSEVKETLDNTVIWGNIYKPWGIVCPLHIVIHDAKGQNLIIEWLDGKRLLAANLR